MTTLTAMKTRIQQELRRTDLSTEIANAIGTAIEAYKYERFSFNQASVVSAPATDGETGNAWMTDAEHLIRSRAKLEIIVNVLKDPDNVDVKLLQAEIEAAIASLKLDRTTGAVVVADTLGFMKNRIAREIKRSGLDYEIENAIRDAIKAYDDERFYFNETRSFTFNTVNGQARYTDADVPNLANIIKFDWMTMVIGSQTFTVKQRTAEFFEDTINMSSNWPSYFGWYDETLVLYPTPNTAVQIRIACVRKLAAPANDSETGNRWMSDGERLIRNRAKGELYAHVVEIADPKLSAQYMALAEEAREQLGEKTTRMTKTGPYLVEPYC